MKPNKTTLLVLILVGYLAYLSTMTFIVLWGGSEAFQKHHQDITQELARRNDTDPKGPSA